MSYEMNVSSSIDTVKSKSSAAAEALYSPHPNLNELSGEQVIGMVPGALAGQYVLYIDGHRFDETTDPETVDLSRVPGLVYILTVSEDGGLPEFSANKST
ncbi:hypothetical protein [Paenibacillus herberti]|uniref:Uncharacterized protein n=1 Tax=Paenibacillus herberti TaxID=1619309 RepID=A0A229P0X3_9BACL|nr:hypothetical protein [Paenibacillus herberti]OXM15549.1 hypothetical protein CGZ75_02080 [Paenibacillus herberti]